MIKRIEFTLNLADPKEAAIYRALKPSLQYRCGGAVIRQALGEHLIVPEYLKMMVVSKEKVENDE